MLKRLIRHNIKDDDVQNNLNKYVDTVDKLAEMDTEINADLLSIMLLYSLPSSFENFRVAIESRDSLPKPDDLKVNIIEEYEDRKANYEDSSQVNEGTLLSKRKFHSKPKHKENHFRSSKNECDFSQKVKFRCHNCNQPNHKARDCKVKTSSLNKGAFNRKSPTGATCYECST